MEDQERAIAEALGHTFRDERLLEVALTHRSAAFEASTRKRAKTPPNNERLEFLGDAVLSLVVCDALWKRFPDATEGELTRMRAVVVNEGRLAEVATRIGLGDALRLGRGEDSTGGRARPSLLANTLEALFAAVYLDAGLEGARGVILALLGPVIDRIAGGEIALYDEKTQLQELLQRQGVTPRYEVVRFEGPDNNRTWYVEVQAGDALRAQGSGRSKKAAEQDAARAVLKALGAAAPAPADPAPDAGEG